MPFNIFWLIDVFPLVVVSCHSLSRRDTGEPGLTSRAEPGAGINIGRWLGGGERGKKEKRQFDELTLAAVEHRNLEDSFSEG